MILQWTNKVHVGLYKVLLYYICFVTSVAWKSEGKRKVCVCVWGGGGGGL